MTEEEKELIRKRILADKEFMAGIRRGLDDRRKGSVCPWSEVKKELGLD